MGAIMVKEIICVYQDCVMCGDKGKKLKQFAENKKLNIRKVSFASEEGKDLIHEAVFIHNVKTMPFYTDGKQFSSNIEDFTKKSKSKRGGKK